MSRATIQNSFSQLIKYPPHKDITVINKYIITGCFTFKVKDVIDFINKTGYESSHFVVDEYIKSVKTQLDEAQNKLGDEFDIEFFCDVAGTELFPDFISAHSQSNPYEELVKFNPDLNFSGNRSKLKQRAFIAVRNKEFKNIYEGVSYINNAIEMALKKIGVNPDEEINGTSKSAVATMHLMDSIGGIQFYLPKNHSLKRIINDVDMYMDSFKMDYKKIAIKHGVNFRTVRTVIKRVHDAIKEYEGKK